MKKDTVRFSTCMKCDARNLTVKGTAPDGSKYVRGSACEHENGRTALTVHMHLFNIVQKWDNSRKGGFRFETPFGVYDSMTAAKSALN